MADFSLQDLWWLKPKEQDNPLPALQLGVQIAQNRAKMDLQERDLANDIARTSLMREEMLAKQKIQTQLTASNAAIANGMSNVTDFNDDEQWADLMAIFADNPIGVGGKAYLGAIHLRESARTAKRLEEEARSRILDRQNDMDLDDRRLDVQEGNLALRGQEIQQKGQKLSIRSQRMYDNELKALNNEETATLKNATGDEAKRLRMGYNLRRRELTSKYYPDAEPAATAPAATPQTVTPENNPRAAEIRESFKQGKITKEQAAQQLRELGFK